MPRDSTTTRMDGLASPLLGTEGRASSGGNPSPGELLAIETRQGAREWNARHAPDCPSSAKRWPMFEDYVNPWSWFWFNWMGPMMRLGSRVSLQMSDVWHLAPKDMAVNVADPFEACWSEEQSRAAANGETPDLMRACMRFQQSTWLLGFFLKLTADLTFIVRPLLMQQVLLIIEEQRSMDSGDGTSGGYDSETLQSLAFYALGMFLSSMIGTLGNVQYNYSLFTQEFRLRSAIIHCLYKKSLVLSPGAKASYSTGKIANLMSNDADKLQPWSHQFQFLVECPIMFLTASFSVVRLLGWAGVIGISVMVFVFPLTTIVIRKLRALRQGVLKNTDKRAKTTTDMLSGIRVVKFMSWERPFHEKISRIRASELSVFRKTAWLQAANTTIMATAPILITVTTLWSYTALFGHTLTPSTAFTALQLLAVLQGPLQQFPNIVTSVLVDGRAAFTRMGGFLLEEERAQYVARHLTSERSGLAIEIKGGTFAHPSPVENPSYGTTAKRKQINPALLMLALPLTPLLVLLYVLRALCGGRKGAASSGTGLLVQRSEVRHLVEKLGRPISDPELDALMSHLRAKPVHIPDLMFAPQCVSMEVVRSRWDAIATVATTEGATITASALRAAGMPATSHPVVLKELNLAIEQGTLCCVVGSVGAGKSSLLLSLLGEMELCKGSVHVAGRVAYAAQSAFLANATLRENIVWDEEWNEEKYRRIVYACALQADLQALPAGDDTQIGERGVNLSGGQKQRVALARVCYSTADVVLLDDTLSAVDAHVGQHIMRHCILDYLKGRTIVMTCHQLHFLRHADTVVSLRGGTVDEKGKYDDLISSDGSFAAMMREYGQSSTNSGELTNLSSDWHASDDDEESVAGSDGSSIPVANLKGQGQDGVLMSVEEREEGRVDIDVYKYYLREFTGVLFLIVGSSFCFGQGSKVLTDWWLGRWSSRDLSVVLFGDASIMKDLELLDYYIAVWACFSLLQVVMQIVKVVCTQLAGLRAARTIHDKLLSRVLHAPSSFFDSTPLGRVINRFTTDIDLVDRAMANQITALFQPLFNLISIVLVVTAALPLILVLYIPVLVYWYETSSMYRSTVRELKRTYSEPALGFIILSGMNSISKSPIFQSFSETLEGLVSIRAFGSEQRFCEAAETRIDENHLTLKVMESCRRWFAMRLQTCSAVLVLGAAVMVTANQAGFVGHPLEAATAGLAITYALNSILALQATIIQSTELEISMNSVERIKYYTELEQEGTALDAPGTALRSAAEAFPNWPRRPTIAFESVAAAYRAELGRVLDDVTIRIEAGEKIAVVGRTGSGKSTLMLLLFRFLELEAGAIFIDGVDISKVKLAELRRCIAILPQDPILFGGSVRENLDPFEQHLEEQLWHALTQAQMADKVRQLPEGLDAPCGLGGEGFSVGERQLLCLARACLKTDAQILVMDEATASVDAETDALLQSMVREVFVQHTVLAIAHRINTIIDYDKVICLDSGRVVEFDTPAALLASGGHFAQLCADAGVSLDDT